MASALLAPGAGAAERLPPVGARAGLTEGAGSLAPGEVLVELGSSLWRVGARRQVAVGEPTLKFAAWRGVDVTLGLGSYVREAGLAARAGFEDPSLGVKVALVAEPATPGLGRPTVEVVVGAVIPVGSDEMSGQAWAPEVRLVVGRALTARVSANANLAYVRRIDEDRGESLGLGALWLGCAVTARLGAYVEAVSEVPLAAMAAGGAIAHGGLTWLLAHDTHLDVHAGHVIAGAGPELVAGAGVAQRW